MSDASGETCPSPVSCSATLAQLYAEDRLEHADLPPVEPPEYRALRERGRRRRERAAERRGDAGENTLSDAERARAMEILEQWARDHKRQGLATASAMGSPCRPR